jgi:nitrogen fixation/metabolism regulation signal transduction histidine kinase
MTQKQALIDTGLSPHDQAVRLMGSWISAIADQVKNPVAGISAAATLIDKQMTAFRASQPWDPAIVEEAVRLMIERLARFDNYLAELSGFTRPVVLNPKWLDLKNEWEAIEQFLARRIAVDFRLRCTFDGNAMVYADVDRLKGALAAIVLNAVDASGSTIDPEISVHVSQITGSDGAIRGCRMQISDNGPGFSKEAILQALVPFFTTKEAGTGLGLAMVEKHVRAHGGYIKVGNAADFAPKSDHHKGGLVELFFPVPDESSQLKTQPEQVAHQTTEKAK